MAAPLEVALDKPAAPATEVSATSTLPASEPPRVVSAAMTRAPVAAPAARFAKPVAPSLALAELPATVRASW